MVHFNYTITFEHNQNCTNASTTLYNPGIIKIPIMCLCMCYKFITCHIFYYFIG